MSQSPTRFRPALLGLLGVLALSVISCRAPATPDPAKVARLVATGIRATLTAMPTATPALLVASGDPVQTPAPPPTDTPLAPTPVPTATSTPRPTAGMRLAGAPAGWPFYEFISGNAIVAHPPAWKTLNEEEDGVAWQADFSTLVILSDITVQSELGEGADAARQARALKSQFLRTHPELDSVTFPQAGKLDLPGDPAFVTVSMRKAGTDASGWLTLIPGQDRVLMLEAIHTGEAALPPGMAGVLTQVADTVRFAPYAIPTPAPTATPPPEQTVKVTEPANLRAGPGVEYAIRGRVLANDPLTVLGKSQNGKWLMVRGPRGEAWIAARLVTGLDAASLAVKTSAAPTVTPAPPSAPQKPPAPASGLEPGPLLQIGQEVEGEGWRFKVSEVHKRKTLYFYNYSYFAQGNFLIVIIDATNLQPGTDYLAKNLKPVVTDSEGKTYPFSSKGSSYAEWQYSKDSAYRDVNPGVSVRIAIVYDLPESTGDVNLDTDLSGPVYLGNFSEMQAEDSARQ